MTITADRVTDRAKDAATAVTDFVSETAGKVDFDDVRQRAGDVVENAAAAAPVAALATKRAFARSTALGLAVSAAFAWFFHADKGAMRRQKAVDWVKSTVTRLKERVSGVADPTAEPATGETQQ